MRMRGKTREAGAFTKFRLLMWKNFVQQWRHPLQTAIELMLPVLTLSIVLVIRWLVEPTQSEAVTFQPVPVQTLKYSIPILGVLNITQMSIAYSPRNDVLEDVVRSAVADVILWNANDFINNPTMNHTEIINDLFPGLNITDIDQLPGLNITDLIDQLPGLNITDLIDQLPGLNITDLIDQLPGLNITDIIDQLPGLNITEIMEQFPGLNITEIINQLPGLNITDIIEQLPGLNITDNPAVYEFIKSLIPVRAYDTSYELRGIYEREDSTREVLAGVEFEDALFGATELPNNISYALRFPQRPRLSELLAIGSRSWRSDVVFPAFESPGPRFPWSPSGGTDPAYVNEMFIALQHGISTQLLSRITGEAANSFEVNLQRFPHPAYLEDFGLEALEMILPMFVMISFSYTAVNIVRAVTVEKEKQLKETLKIMGLPTWINWISWFCKQFIYLAVAAVLITVLLKVRWFTNADGFTDYALFTNTPWTVLIFFILLYLTCTIFFCFMLSGFFSKGSTAALFAGVLWFLTYTPAFLLSIDISMSVSVQMLTCLSLNSAMAYGFQLLISRENIGGMHWGDFMISPSTNSSRLLFGHVIIMLCVNCVLYMLVALYLEQVLPGPFGAPKPWYFLFQRNFWRSGKVSGLEAQRLPETPQVTKEREPIHHSIGVKMTNLTKIYGENIAVKKLTMNIYDDQITVLLGHNGAGKSTTISMLTGNLEASSGSMYVAGYDMAWDTAAARAHIGLCPQHNVLFDDLTVREHLEFFSKLKGFEGAELKNEIETLVTKLELLEKLNCQSKGLSGGQKRRLCVGIALCGDARVVLLDEPTSGMDPSSRRALWDLLQKEKKGRCMILTTHFMDEADILGDRIAIMSSGKLQCIGSPYFLKQHYGIGYTLVIVKNDGFQLEECTKLLTKYIPNIMVKEDRGTEVSYSMTHEHSRIFETMLNDLENHIEIIKFKNYGLVATTLEDVFMSIGSDVETSNSETDYSTTTSETMSDVLTKKYDFDATSMDSLDESKPIRGYRLLLQHVLAVWLKLYLVWSRTWVVKLLQLLVPVLILVSTLGILEYVMSLRSTLYRRPLTLEEGYTSTETLLNFAGNYSTSRGALALNAYQEMFNSSGIPTMTYSIIDEPLDEFYTRKTYEPVAMSHARHHWLTGATFTDAGATAWFSNFAHHDIATSLAAVHSALLKATHPKADIRVFNYPLEVQYQDQRDLQGLLAVLSMQLSSGIGSSLSIACAAFIMFYIKERVSRAKLLQKASGIQPIVLWSSAAVFDWIWFLFIALSVIISIAVFSLIGMWTVEDLGRLYLLLIIYGAAMLPLVYLASHWFNGPATGFVVLFFTNVLLGSLAAQVVDILYTPMFNAVQVAEILDMLLQFFPLYSLITSARSLHNMSLTTETCLGGCDHLVTVIGLDHCDLALMCERVPEMCCVPENAHFDWEKPGVLRYIIAMLVSCLVLWTIFMAIEYNVIQRFFKRKQIPPPALEDDVDSDVLDEARHAEATTLSGHSLVAHKLSKYYGKNLAVNQISFSVSEGECFGLLGVNGAGKTSTFKMLMGDETVSSGNAFVGGHSVRTDITKVHENIGYCPQFDAVFEELTGRETLRLFSLLRGLSATHTAARSAALAHALGFTKHLDKKVSQYSGGNKRKLSTAVALLGNTRMVFVDEPTTGVDPAAKRQVWRAIRSAQRAGRGVVLTSHSMEECEALCSRLTIMVNGRFQCLGTPQHLKNKYSEGFTLTIKMKVEEEQPSTSSCNVSLPVDAVKSYVEANFVTPKLMEEYQGLLTYYLPDKTTVWSRMFGIMERAKQDLPIEDYSISQTSLEQIFLQFTKYQRKTKPIK